MQRPDLPAVWFTRCKKLRLDKPIAETTGLLMAMGADDTKKATIKRGQKEKKGKKEKNLRGGGEEKRGLGKNFGIDRMPRFVPLNHFCKMKEKKGKVSQLHELNLIS